MDLATGAKQTFVMMDLFSREGTPKLVLTCSYPLTGARCVTRIYTDHAVFVLVGGEVVVRDLVGAGFDKLQSLLDVPLAGAHGQGGPDENSRKQLRRLP